MFAVSPQLASEHWKKFAGQDYFDQKGFFASVMWSGPLLIILIVVIVNMLFQMFHLMVKVKRAEFKRKGKLKARIVEAEGAGAGEAAPKAETKKDS